jgi:hypothetical protein
VTMNPLAFYHIAMGGSRAGWSPVNVRTPQALHGVLRCDSAPTAPEGVRGCVGLEECGRYFLTRLFSTV